MEIAQNIIFYSANRIEIPDDEAGYGTLTISEADGAITISGENTITESQKNKEIRLDYLFPMPSNVAN